MVSDVSKDGVTVTVKLADPVFPSMSVAVHVIVLVPIGRSVLYAGEQPWVARDEFGIKFPLLSHTAILLWKFQSPLSMSPKIPTLLPSHLVNSTIPE